MRVERGASQVLFGMLPNQTVDLEGRVWKVEEWVDPVAVNLDPEAVKAALLGAIVPWERAGNDGGIAEDLRRGSQVGIAEVNEDRGVLVSEYPRQWRCRECGRI